MASMPGVPFTSMTSTPRSTRSRATSCATCKFPRYQPISIVTLRPSVQPTSVSPRRNTSIRPRPSGSLAAIAIMTPTRFGFPDVVWARLACGTPRMPVAVPAPSRRDELTPAYGFVHVMPSPGLRDDRMSSSVLRSPHPMRTGDGRATAAFRAPARVAPLAGSVHDPLITLDGAKLRARELR